MENSMLKGKYMKRINYLVLAIIFMSSLPFRIAYSSDAVIPSDDINVEPIPGDTHHYSVNIKFDTIESVTVSTTIVAESLGIKHESYDLQKNEWDYDPVGNILHAGREIDNTNYIVRVTGRYRTPLCIITNEKIDPAKIRLVIDGRIGIPGKDYHYDSIKNEIELITCKTGKENYILQYHYSQGSASIGSMNSSGFTRSLLKYLEWPTEGNAVQLDQKGLRFSPRETVYKSVWLVQLLPAGDGYTGRDILSGFHWDSIKNELTFNEPVDTEKYSVMILGEEK